MWRRLVGAALFVVASGLFGGCQLSGTLDVRSADQVVVDFTIADEQFDREMCTAGYWGGPPDDLTVDFSDAGGDNSCRIRGSVHPEKLRQYLDLSQAGDYLSVHINPLNVALGGEPSGGSQYYTLLYADLDLTVTFPGGVLTATGDIDFNSVHFRDPEQFVRAYGLQATALSHPGPQWSLIGPAVGVAAGVIATLLWQAVRRRRAASLRSAAAQDAAHEAAAEGHDAVVATVADALDGAPSAGTGAPDEYGSTRRTGAGEAREDDRRASSDGRRVDPSQWAPRDD